MMMNFVAFPAVICCSLTPAVTAIFWGDWGDIHYCPNNGWAVGFALKTESPQGSGDDTALNGISLLCSGGEWISSTEGPRGDWGANFICPDGAWLTSCQHRVEDEQRSGDDTAANNMNCHCNNGDILYGDGTNWGDWIGWNRWNTCNNGIKGIQTRVEGKQIGDDTALNDVHFECW